MLIKQSKLILLLSIESNSKLCISEIKLNIFYVTQYRLRSILTKTYLDWDIWDSSILIYLNQAEFLLFASKPLILDTIYLMKEFKVKQNTKIQHY